MREAERVVNQARTVRRDTSSSESEQDNEPTQSLEDSSKHEAAPNHIFRKIDENVKLISDGVRAHFDAGLFKELEAIPRVNHSLQRELESWSQSTSAMINELNTTQSSEPTSSFAPEQSVDAELNDLFQSIQEIESFVDAVSDWVTEIENDINSVSTSPPR